MEQALLAQAQQLRVLLAQELERATQSRALVHRLEGPSLLAVATARLDALLELQVLGDKLAGGLHAAPRPLGEPLRLALEEIRQAAARLDELNDALAPLLEQAHALLDAWRTALVPNPGLYGRSAARAPQEAPAPRPVHSRRA